MRDLGTLGGAGSRGYGINNAGQVTGNSNLGNASAEPTHAFRYDGTPGSGGVMRDSGHSWRDEQLRRRCQRRGAGGGVQRNHRQRGPPCLPLHRHPRGWWRDARPRHPRRDAKPGHRHQQRGAGDGVERDYRQHDQTPLPVHRHARRGRADDRPRHLARRQQSCRRRPSGRSSTGSRR